MRDEGLDVWVQTERGRADELANLKRDNVRLREALAQIAGLPERDVYDVHLGPVMYPPDGELAVKLAREALAQKGD